jgi:3-hydroxybutyryl-CoA dehydratase
MRIGDSLPTLFHRVDPAAMAELATILRDPNPIHLSAEAAQAAGLGDRVINQGPANLAYIINMLSAAFPGHRLDRLESRYLANVHGGDLVEAGGTVTGINGEAIECEAWLQMEAGEKAFAVRATLVPR